MSGVESGPAEPEFNPLRYPPCACPLHRAEQEPAQEPEPEEDSPSLRALRARITEENRLRRRLRGSS
ncbi:MULTISPECIES: hypothetical protein [Streptomyces]|uniref:hypothetical protein n=1 Tax=Streptomyces TaxID=1883 RepID=UPI001164A5CA|nr:MULTISPECIES: hypothetical protein [unclassified Streptomyces]MBL0779862.1 hypothetical protein [Streptomyces albidoflavus]MBV1957695.1 hypothetical protein [Streptomyces sp. BV333]QDD59995.1 hypothetical protein FE156_16865 [Streptomyces albidoflavus]UDF11183.1 hypothetical protein LH646_28365 [Streptomyces sp. WA1-19]